MTDRRISSHEVSMTFDHLIKKLGGFGRYQIRSTILLCIAAASLNAWSYNLVFLLYSPGKTCEEWNMNFTRIKKYLGPTNDQCDYEGAEIQNQTVHCENWTIDREYFDSTLRTQWGLCQRDFLSKNVLGIFAIAVVVGLSVMSVVQDYFGRRVSFFVSLTLTLIGSSTSLFAPSLTVFIILRCIHQSQFGVLYSLPFVWAQEFVGPEHRTLVNCLMVMSYSIASASLALIAYLCRTWVQLGMTTALPFALLYSYFFLLDESPRWLLSEGKFDDAKRVVKKMANVNKINLSDEEIKNDLSSIAALSNPGREKREKRIKPFELFSSFNSGGKVILLTIIWAVNGIVYDALSYNASNFGNIFVAYVAQALAEAPASMVNMLLLNRIGRMPPLILAMAFCATISFVCIPAYIEQWNQWFIIIFSALCKFSISVSFNSVYQASGELYPTSLRATGIGINNNAANLAGIALPYILESASMEKWFPMLILGTVASLGTICACFLPETKNQPMPQTVQESDKISRLGFHNMKTHTRNLIKC